MPLDLISNHSISGVKHIEEKRLSLFSPNRYCQQEKDSGHDHHEQEQATLASTASIMVQSHSHLEGQKQLMKAHPMQVAGSRLPDCTHACGSCSPCRLVMVSFVLCASLTQAETCPISYRCMCNGKSYPVP
ncbi:hypothetical protein ACB092_06G086200 [Castanea dentata]